MNNSMEQFSEEFSNIINESALLMINQRKKELSVLHICYAFFQNPKIKEISSRYFDKIEDLQSEIISITNSYENKSDIADVSEDVKEILKSCITKINNNEANKIKKITSFDFMETVLDKMSDNEIFVKFNIDHNLISKIKSTYINENIKASIRKRAKPNKEEEKNIEDKNDVRNFITNISEKIQIEPPVVLDFDFKIDEIINVLLRKEKSNPLLIGKPGVGKSVLIEGLALAIKNKNVPKSLENKKIIEINLTSLVSGTNFRGDFEKRFENIINYLEKEGDIIVFIDEIHCMKGLGSTGSSKGELDFSNMIKPYLSSGKISCIGATTFDEYKNSIEKDKALDRRFKTIQLKEPSIKITQEILNYKKKVYENFHKVKIDDTTLNLLVDLTDRYITKGAFPDKAFDVLDMCLSEVKKNNKAKATISDVIESISKISNIDKNQIKGSDTIILSLESDLKEKIFGQEKAIKMICEKIIVAKTGFSNPLKPLASFLLIGTTGVGKTEVVNEISKRMTMDLLRLDMSEYSEKGSTSKLIGTSAGYVGYEDGGKLTDFVLRNPHAVILFDEIEKADKSVYNLFLQILDYGKITDGSGREVDFRNTLIFMTSNSGVDDLNSRSIGFKENENHSNDKFEKSLTKTFSPEFLNRISKIVLFEKLTLKPIEKLVDKSLKALSNKLLEKEIEIEFTNVVKKIVVKNGFNDKMGARPLERYIEDNITFLIATNMIKKLLKSKTKYQIDYENSEFVLKIKRA